VFDAVKSITDDIYVFGKSSKKIDPDTLDIKKKLLTLYISEELIIDQILNTKGDWFKSNNPKTNYIEFESIEKYNTKKDISKYIACYEK
jgi:hypothetical protein